MEKNFWINNSNEYTELLHTSLKNVLHPLIAQTINDAKPKKILNYGCGDGRMAEMINKEISISIFDISEEMLEQAEKRLGTRVEFAYRNIVDIPANTFDVVVSSLVFICIDNEKDFTTAMQSISNSLAKNGKAIITMTHPCFRQYSYSDYFTSFTKGMYFDYYKEAQPFEVTIHDKAKKLSVTFTDYHWTLSYTLNKMIQSGLNLENIIETEDDKSISGCNKQFPPFIILIARKHEK